MSTPTPRSRVRVLIIEDHALFAESLELALGVEGYPARRVEVPEHASSTGLLLARIQRLRPTVVLMDLDLGNFGDGGRLIEPLAKAGISVVVITSDPDQARWGECLRHGARTVLSKSRPLNDVLAVVRRISQGLSVLPIGERENLLRIWHERRIETGEIEDRLSHLTVRECEILAHLMNGHTVREIAALSTVSEATVRTQVKSILAKLDVSSQLAAVGLAHRIEWKAPAV